MGMEKTIQSNQKMKFISFGNLFKCTECGELRGVIKGREFNMDEYEQIRMKCEKEWNVAQKGEKLLSSMLEDNKYVCSKCEILKIKIVI